MAECCFVELLQSIWGSWKCILLLIAATLYRAILFLIFLSASVGPATLVCYLYANFTGREVYPEVQPSICMMLISCWAEFSIGVEKRFCGNIVEHFKNGYPTIMGFGRFTIHFIMYIVAYIELYLEFERAHTIPEPHRGHHRNSKFYRKWNSHEEQISVQSMEEREAAAQANEPYHVTIFLFALAYLVFVTSRNFHKDLLLVVRNLPTVTFSILNNWLVRVAFAVIHTFVNLFYFLPCLAIAYTAANYRTSGLTTYFQLTFTAGMAGMVAALFELNRPWPQRRGQLPFLFHENNIFGKNLLAHALIIAILYCFYRPKKHPKVLESKFDSTNHDVICFCLIVAFTTLHIVKFGVHAVLSLAHEYDNRMNEINNHVVELPVVRENSSSSGNRGVAGNIAEEGGMCARCIANMVNNNSHIPPPPPTANNQNNNDTSSSQPQGELGQGRNEVGNAMEQGKLNENEDQENMNNDDQKAKCDILEQKPQCNMENVNVNPNDLDKISASASPVDKECQESLPRKNLQIETRIEIPEYPSN